MSQHWNDTGSYEYTRKLNASQWAWEFLRRNAEYQKDWYWFNETWQAMEADYGSPPNRDMSRWKQDQRAWRSEAELHGCDAAVCEKKGDGLLIECWMGAKWGFFKFPLDPHKNAAEVKDILSWRELEAGVQLVDRENATDINNELNVALMFDLTLPLRQQLEEAKRFLVASQRTLKKAGKLESYCITGSRKRWKKGLQLLDARNAGESEENILLTLFEGNDLVMAELAMEVEAYVAGGYTQILLMPERR